MASDPFALVGADPAAGPAGGALDDPRTLKLDSDGMLSRVITLGDSFAGAWDRYAQLELHGPAACPRNMIVAGVGGSASGGDYAGAVAVQRGAMPFDVVRGFALPRSTGPRTLVVCCSFSGDTEETLACYDHAGALQAPRFAIRSGGELHRRAARDDVQGVVLDCPGPPRAALGDTLAVLLRLGNTVGATDVTDDAVRAAASAHARMVACLAPGIPAMRNPAKQAALRIASGRIPIVVASGELEAPARRMRNQLAENGKTFAIAASLPEAGHNLVVALDAVHAHRSELVLVTLEAPEMLDPRLTRRFDTLATMFESEGIPVTRIRLAPATLLPAMLEATAWADLISFYVALARGIDPSPIAPIEQFKSGRSGRGQAPI